MATLKNAPVALIIMDGCGLGDKTDKNNAVQVANTPVLDGLLAKYKTSQLQASGEFVGLPDGQMGNSEVGHTNIGAGRIIYQHDGHRIYTSVIRKVIYDTSGPAFDDSAIGKSIFLTREAAATALAASQKKGGVGT